jgi:predicted DNA-binding transcriptional regulator
MEALDEPFSELAMLLGRAFYEDLEVLILDKLVLLRQPLTDRELAEVLHLSERQVRKALVPLLRDRLVSKATIKLADVDATTATAAEFREHQRTLGEMTSISVDLGIVPDFAKFKLHMLRKRLASTGECGADGAVDATAWRCESCDLSFTEADVFTLFDRDRQAFTCDACGKEIEAVAADPDALDATAVEGRRRRLEAAIAPLLVALGRCDKQLEEGRNAPPLLRAAGAVQKASEPAAAGGSGRPAVPNGGARALARAAGNGGTTTEEEQPLTVEIGVSSSGLAPGAKGGGARASAAATLFWQADAAENARKRSREEDETRATAAAEEAQAAKDAAWAEQLKHNQERQTRERVRATGVPLGPVPALVAAAGGAGDGVGKRAADPEGDDWDEEEETTVAVQGVPKKLSEVTEEDTERMSSDEYKRWYELNAE